MFDSSIPEVLSGRNGVSQGSFTIKVKFTRFKGPYMWLSKKETKIIHRKKRPLTLYKVNHKQFAVP